MTTPIRRQYLDIKRRYPQAIVFFRLGDFYETFDDDAKLCARELEITLTSKPMGKNLRVPLAGIPHHALDGHLAKLIAKGYKVAICEQMEEPGPGKKLVDRQVVRVVTPGTVLDGSLLDERANNYLAALTASGEAKAGRRANEQEGVVGLAYADVSTGEFVAGELPASQLSAELARLRPAELLLPEDAAAPPDSSTPATLLPPYWFDSEAADEALREHFRVASLEAFGLRGQPQAVAAAGAVLRYLQENQRGGLSQMTGLAAHRHQGYMLLDEQTQRNLELFAGGREGRREASLLGVLDLTRTALGARLLRRWLGRPLLDINILTQRQDGVAYLFDDAMRRAAVRQALGAFPDLERLCARIAAGMASPREVVALRRGLEAVAPLREALSPSAGQGEALPSSAGEGRRSAPESVVGRLLEQLKPCDDTVTLIADAIADEPAPSPSEGGVVREGFSPELDRLRALTGDVRRFVAEMESAEKARTGIKSLKVGYNKVFGYYIEVSKPNLSLVPSDYERRQTLVGAERFITGQLKEYEAQILNARERIAEMESAIFRQVCAQVSAAADRILALAAAVAQVDTLAALAEAAARYGYVRPEVVDSDELVIKEGRHPVVEQALGEGRFVPNDSHLSAEEQILILTGPNMAGKSTYLRQVALIVLMAQVGSYVPAAWARIGLVDRIFTRVGAQEDLAAGQSTFMTEMLETANILHNATPRSLVVLDEIGRGTSTYDGLAIARAVVEYLHNRSEVAARTVFATHYHELVEMASLLPRVRNYNVAVSEEGGRVVFLRKIVPGGSDKSYGIHVAELAGLPRAVVQRAWDVLASLEATHDGATAARFGKTPGRRRQAGQPPCEQLPLFGPKPPLLDEIASLDVDAMTPLEAINKLYELRQRTQEA